MYIVFLVSLTMAPLDGNAESCWAKQTTIFFQLQMAADSKAFSRSFRKGARLD
jgi:hypothetical protein